MSEPSNEFSTKTSENDIASFGALILLLCIAAPALIVIGASGLIELLDNTEE